MTHLNINKLKTHYLWQGQVRRLSWFEAFVDLLCRANLDENNQLKVSTNQTLLARVWGWNRNSVKKFLDRLQNEKLARHQVVEGRITLVIINSDQDSLIEVGILAKNKQQQDSTTPTYKDKIDTPSIEKVPDDASDGETLASGEALGAPEGQEESKSSSERLNKLGNNKILKIVRDLKSKELPYSSNHIIEYAIKQGWLD